jgi:hypothetical protein
MIGSVRDYLNWVTTDDNGYLTQEEATRWRLFVQSIEGQNTQQTVIGALGSHLPEPIPDALHEDPELDLGGYWLGLEDPRVDVTRDRHPYTGSLPENIDLEEWFGRKLGPDSDSSPGSSSGSTGNDEDDDDEGGDDEGGDDEGEGMDWD